MNIRTDLATAPHGNFLALSAGFARLQPDPVGNLLARSALILALVLAPISQVYAQLVTRVVDGDTLIVHLRMTGKLQVMAGEDEPGKHTHIVLDLDDGRRLHYTDPRKFGRIWLVPDPEPLFRKLGPEPLGNKFTPAAFAEQLHGRRASIKALLLNQSIIAGVGNIYADESLFLAGVRPTRPGGDLAAEEVVRLHAAVRAILTQAIESRGSSLGPSSLQNYQRPGGEAGGFQDRHRVFQRTGQPCPVCGTPIERIVLAQRSTHFCPTCQI